MIYILSTLVFIIVVRKNWSETFLIYAPLIDTFHNFLPGKDIGNDIPRFVAFTMVYASFYLKNRLVLKRQIKGATFVRLVLLFILLLFISLTQSTDLTVSGKWLLNYVFALLAIIIYFFLFAINNNPDFTFNKFMKICFSSAALWLTYILFCTYFKLGKNTDDYAVTSFIHLGYVNFYQIFPWVYLLFVFPYFFIFKSNKLYYLSVWIGSALVFLFIAKRTYVYLTLASAVLTMIPYSLRKRKLSYVFFFSLIILFTSYVAGDLIQRYFLQARAASLEISFFEEGRWMELTSYKIEMIDREPTTNILIGKELFNSQGKFFKYTSDIIHMDKMRILHSDFSTLLYGSGIIGITLYILMLIFIGNYVRIITRNFQILDSKLILYKYTVYGLITLLLFNGLSDGILGFSNRFIPFMLIGTFTGILTNYYKIQLQNAQG
jgi:hypothetical protein